ncbi:MAG: cobyrinic acid a,c-diamide synthase [Cyanobacteria bacterium P01_F01_bin.3]
MSTFDLENRFPVLSALPTEASEWLTTLPWDQRRYILSLCHLVCATPPEQQAEFLDAYTAEGLLSHIAADADTRRRVNEHLTRFRCEIELNDDTFRHYIRHVYLHSMKDGDQRPELYLETVLMLIGSARKRSSVLCYILGFEILKLLISMSWSQHERLSSLQVNEDQFIRTFIQPVQQVHKQYEIVVPRGGKEFFARRDYFIQEPKIEPQRLVELVIESFSADRIIEIGFTVLRHPNAIHFDHDYVYEPHR